MKLCVSFLALLVGFPIRLEEGKLQTSLLIPENLNIEISKGSESYV